MRARTDRRRYGSTSAPLVALCLLTCLSLSEPVSIAEAAPNPDAPTVTGCPMAVLVSNGSISSNEYAPNANWLFGRSVYLITAADAAANGFSLGPS